MPDPVLSVAWLGEILARCNEERGNYKMGETTAIKDVFTLKTTIIMNDTVRGMPNTQLLSKVYAIVQTAAPSGTFQS